MGSHVATIHLIHELVLRDVQRREQLRRGFSNRAGRTRMPRAMPGPLLGEPWAREPHLARGELGHAAHQGRPRLGRARPCPAAAQATRDGYRAAAPTGRRATRQRAAPRPPAPGSRPRRGHARRGYIARAGATVAEAACPAEIDARPCRRGWLGGRAREPCGRRAAPATGADARRARPFAAGPRPPRACSPSRERVLAPGGHAQAARAGPPGPPCRRGRALVAAAAAPWPLHAGEPRRAAAMPLQGGGEREGRGKGRARASGVEGERGTCAGSGRERRR
jgi:hypothetical protein